MIGLPHSFCKLVYAGSSGSERAEEEEISETFEAVDALVEERGRDVTRGSLGDGRGTESIIVWASVKAFCR